MKELYESDELKEIGEKIIAKENLDFGNTRIGYVMVEPYISKTVCGKCIRSNNELKLFSNKDYIIEISFDIWNKLEPEQQELLMLHELMHILVVQDKEGNNLYKIRPHDIEDFEKIIKKYGTDWIKKIKLSVSSLYDLDPSQEDLIKI